MHLLAQAPSASHFFLFLALGLALGFEFVNGFHDTANAVATVIYTNSLKPYVAVVWSGLWNLLGVLSSTGAVAFSIVALLPVELVLHVGSGAGFAMIFALLISAMVWNLGTWYLGLPASSSHTLVGAIIGVGMANAWMSGRNINEGVDWGKVKDVGMTLLVSPVLGFICAGLLLLVLKLIIKSPQLYAEPQKDKAPPLWIRSLLVLTCTGVSFSHGNNDGQKGMGLLVLILVGILPGTYALKMDTDAAAIQRIAAGANSVAGILDKDAGHATMPASDAEKELQTFLKPGGGVDGMTFAALAAKNREIAGMLGPLKNMSDLSEDDRRALRQDLFLAGGTIGKLIHDKEVTDAGDVAALKKYQGDVDYLTKYIPLWVKIAVACALGFGTMIGWKRIVVTVGEKIGKTHLSYAQGLSAELVAMITIGAASKLGLPVSTTHVLSSGVAGTMAANGSGLQMATLRNIVLAWILTLPACIFLGATLFAGGLYVVFHVLGLH